MQFVHFTTQSRMVKTMANAPLSVSAIVSQSFPLISSINSVLQTLNPQHPRFRNPDPSPLNQFSPLLNPHLVIQVIKNQSNPYHALFFFNWASNPNPNPNKYTHSHFAYSAITDRLITRNLFSLATDLLERTVNMSDFMVGKFIKAHGDRGHVRWALHLFHRVRIRESGKCLFSYNAILGVLVRENQVNLAKKFFDLIGKEGVIKPDVSTYTTMIRAYCKIGFIEDARKMFDEMTCRPNIVTYNTLVSGLCKKGLMNDARRIVCVMTENKESLPDTVTYTTLIDGYCKKGELHNANECFSEMLRKKCEPNELTYNALINGLCLLGEIDDAKTTMTRMRLKGVKDNVATHTSLLKGFCVAGRSQEAFEHFKEIVSLGMKPDVKMYGVLVNEYCKLRKPNEAISLLSQMRERGLRPSVASFNAVFRSLLDVNELDRALLLLKQMPQMGFKPNFLSYKTVIYGLVKAGGRMRAVEGLVKDMVREGHEFDVTLYSIIVEGYCEDGNEELAMKTCQEMIGKGYVMRLESFSIFVKEMCARGKVFEVEKILEQMAGCCSVTDVRSYRKILNEGLDNNNSSLLEN